MMPLHYVRFRRRRAGGPQRGSTQPRDASPHLWQFGRHFVRMLYNFPPRLAGQTPSLKGTVTSRGPVAKWIRRWSSEPKIAGSSPAGVMAHGRPDQAKEKRDAWEADATRESRSNSEDSVTEWLR